MFNVPVIKHVPIIGTEIKQGFKNKDLKTNNT